MNLSLCGRAAHVLCVRERVTVMRPLTLTLTLDQQAHLHATLVCCLFTRFVSPLIMTCGVLLCITNRVAGKVVGKVNESP